MDYNMSSTVASEGRSIEISKVLRNTYMLLALTLVFSAIVCGIAAYLQAPRPNFIITLVVFYGLLFAIEKTKESAMGLVLVFALTGYMGFTLGPIIGMLVASGATEIVMMALGGTGLTFFGLSAYVLITRKDMSFLGGMMTALFFVLIFAVIASFFFSVPGLSLAISALFIIFSSMAILYQTSSIIHGGETNYISATVTLYVSIYNLFLSLLNLLMAFSGDD